MLTELRDSVPMTLKCMGIDPGHARPPSSGCRPSTRSSEAADSGQIRRFTGNDYIRDLATGDVAIALGWSGDAVQLQKDNPNIKFVMPKEGCMLWSTSMEIPVGAPNPRAAAGVDELRLRPEGAGRHRRVRQLRHPRRRASSRSSPSATRSWLATS